MVSLNKIAVYFGAFVLFKNVSFLINPRDRIGLVGRNGAGKTSLFRIIIGEMGYDEGTVSMPSNISLGYLPQQIDVTNSTTVLDETISAFDEVLALEKRIEEINHQLEIRDDYKSTEYLKLIDDLSHIQERFHLLEGDSLHSQVEQVLLGLGFDRKDFTRPTSELSGGWRMRIELAKILLKKPSLLLLDEPTNHLDIESIQWLEDYLKDYKGAVLLISHDRIFLDSVTTRTIEISLGMINDYSVSYTKYVELRKERFQQQQAAFKNQQKKIEETEDFIERFRYKATKAVQVQSRIKQLEKLQRIEVDQQDNTKLKFRFPPSPHSGKIILDIKSLTKKYGELMVLNDIDLDLEKGEKIAFVGRNGEGKSTLAKVIIGQLQYSGHFKLGHNVKIGYYAQNQNELLDDNKTVFEVIDHVATGDMRTKTRDLLGSFLFSGETIDKKVKVLSGGERSRLALAKMLLDPVNLLVLDEPTNHLDMASKEIFKQTLQQYDGTLILVSHDRDFLDGLVDKVIEFRNNKLKTYLGGIKEFLSKRKISAIAEIEKKDKERRKRKKSSDQKVEYEQRKEFDREIRKAAKKVSESESKISKLEIQISEMDNLLAKPENISDQSLFTEYGLLKKNLEDEMSKWENLHEELEKAEEDKKNLFGD